MMLSERGLSEQSIPPRDGKTFFPSRDFGEAMARLEFLVERQRRLGLLLGAGGTGKSTVLQAVGARMRAAGLPVVSLNLTGLEPGEFLWHVAVGLQSHPAPDEATSTLWRRLGDRLTAYRYEGVTPVLLFDDADRAGSGTIADLLRLLRWSSSPEPRFTAVLGVEPSKLLRLGTSLLEATDLQFELEPWSDEDVADYLRWASRLVGAEASLFDPDAVSLVSELSGGVARNVVQFAEMSLLAGAASSAAVVTPEIVQQVHDELLSLRA